MKPESAIPIVSPLDLGPQYRQKLLAGLPTKRYDVLVIGGGINGAGIAYDAAMRGFSVLVVEKSDFAAGTSSRSSKLIHGGIRYLKQMEFGLVFESLRERTLLLKLSPHLVRPMPFLYPIYDRDPDSHLAIRIGLTLYDVLSLYRAPARHKNIKLDEVAQVEPALGREGLKSCPRYYDAWTNDARLVLATMMSAIRSGADALNHVELRSLLRDGQRLTGAVLTDRLTGQDVAVEARQIINAAGPWLDQITTLDHANERPRIKPTKGVHLLVGRDRLSLNNSVLLRSPDDGRVLFAIPWERMTLIGTTDTFFDGSPDEVYADRSDVDYLLRAANHSFPTSALEPKDVRSTYAGLRPLIDQTGKSASEMSREHEMWETPGGLLCIGGGKYTTFRSMSEEVVDRAAELLQKHHGLVRRDRCTTDQFPLEGGAIGTPEEAVEKLKTKLAGRGDALLAEHLVMSFGTHAPAILQEAGDNANSLNPLWPGLPYSMAELRYIARYEMPGRLTDLLLRRTQLQLEAQQGALSIAEPIARELAPLLGWSDQRVQQELDLYETEVRKTLRCVESTA